MDGGQLSLFDYLLDQDDPTYSFTPEELSVFNFRCINEVDIGIPKKLKRRLQKVAECSAICGEGIHATQFPSYYEAVVHYPLSLDELDYKCLKDLLDVVPDIFFYRSNPDDQRDYIIYPASDFTLKVNDAVKNLEFLEQFATTKMFDYLVVNIRKLLKAHPEGITIQEIQDIYNENYKNPLDIGLLHFSDIESFLLSIKRRVPFRFDSIDDKKCMYLIKTRNTFPDSGCEKPKSCKKIEGGNMLATADICKVSDTYSTMQKIINTEKVHHDSYSGSYSLPAFHD